MKGPSKSRDTDPSPLSDEDKEQGISVTEDIEDSEDIEGNRRNRGNGGIEREWCDRRISLFSKPHREFLIEALKMNAAEIESRSLSDEGWMSPAWTFAWLCKGRPGLEKFNAVDAWSKVRDGLRELAANGVDVWDQLGADEDEAGLDFIYAWDRIRVNPAKDILQNATDRADKCALRPPVNRGLLYTRFVSILGHLQVIRGSEPIIVPLGPFSDILGCAQMTVSRMIHFAMEDGLLQLVANHSRANKRARRFRFAVERYEGL